MHGGVVEAAGSVRYRADREVVHTLLRSVGVVAVDSDLTVREPDVKLRPYLVRPCGEKEGPCQADSGQTDRLSPPPGVDTESARSEPAPPARFHHRWRTAAAVAVVVVVGGTTVAFGRYALRQHPGPKAVRLP